jgi:FtsP/CotA-like multicopper oxidase with cupredoxin domain
LPDGSEFTVMRVSFTDKVDEARALPERLSTPHFYQVEEADNQRRPRRFEIAMRRMQWLINGRSFEMEGVARDEIVKLGDLEVWEFDNQQAGMQMIHPMHIHNVQFQVIDRQVLPQYIDAWQTVSAGLVDEGWKDTVLVMPGERVKLLVKFEHNGGLYLYHCHNLEHEDMGFMRNFRIKT